MAALQAMWKYILELLIFVDWGAYQASFPFGPW
jgi:hypothetical protein